MFLLYDLLLFLAFVAAAPWFLLSPRRRRKYLGSFRRRLGSYGTPAAEHDVWIHAVSVGEVGAAKLIADRLLELRSDLRLLVTTTTATGQAAASRTFIAASVTYFPFDFSFSVKRFLAHHQPRVFASIETEIWPNVVRMASRGGVQLLLCNARLSDESFPRYLRLRLFLRPLLARYARILARDREDQRRFIAIGAPAAIVTVEGNVKFDQTSELPALPFEPLLREWIGSRFLFIAGSTMAGEDEMLIAALPRLISHGCAVAIAPRKPERFEVVASLLQRSGSSFFRRSSIESDARQGDVFLLDSLGELARLYRLAGAAFIGGSLVPMGGHNPVEAAAAGAATCFGPHMTNFRDVAMTFLAAGAARQVASIDELVSFVGEMSTDAERRNEMSRRSLMALEQNRGAARRNAEQILERLR